MKEVTAALARAEAALLRVKHAMAAADPDDYQVCIEVIMAVEILKQKYASPAKQGPRKHGG